MLFHGLEQRWQRRFAAFPWRIAVTLPDGHQFLLGQQQAHWYPEPLRVHLHSRAAVTDFDRLNGLRLVDRYLHQEIDLDGNFHILTAVKAFVPFRLNPWQLLRAYVQHHAFQNIRRARVNVKSHYDISQALLEKYLDVRYMAYSCAMFEDTTLSEACMPDLRRPGQGAADTYDSLEKAQWRKFRDGVDFVAPAPGETLLDVGCGYGGQLEVALEEHPFGKVVGWTHSSNQIKKGAQLLAAHDPQRWEMHEGDYRQDKRIYDHITSTGMICHVGPRGLVPYVRHIRRHIRQGGRYVHHCLMADYTTQPLDRQIGVAFNKRYVWPGFHWFTLGEHVRVLEQNGFKVLRTQNLRTQYTKTLTAWYQRFMQHRDEMAAQMGEPSFRAWRLYLGGGAGTYSGDINRIYCVAI